MGKERRTTKKINVEGDHGAGEVNPKEGGFADPPSIMLPLPRQEANMSNSNTPTFSQQLPSLLQHHFEQLHIQSGIVVDVIKERGCESVLGKKCHLA